MNTRGITMNDDIERINEENRKFDSRVSPGDQSQARHSSITTPDEDERKKKMAENIIAELSNHTQEIDAIKQAIQVMSEQMNQITAAINQLAQGKQAIPSDPNQKGLNIEALGQLGDLLDKGISAYKQLKGAPEGPAPLIDQAFINERMKTAFLDDYMLIFLCLISPLIALKPLCLVLFD